jgi:citrate synthase
MTFSKANILSDRTKRREFMQDSIREAIIGYTDKYSKICTENNLIENSQYEQFGIKRGLRDKSGKGVLAGITNISMIQSYQEIDGKSVPCDGRLLYRGYDIFDIAKGLVNDKHYGFEEITHLLLFSTLPNEEELAEFKNILSGCRYMPKNFVRDVIMKAPSKDIMNSLTKSILTMASYDDRVADLSLDNVLRQCLSLISMFPMLSVYGYHAYNHYECGESLYIHRPDDNLSTAENLLRMLRPDKKYTEIEAKVLDIALILHMEHGGGNNSTFTTRVVTSSGSDTYSVIAAALSSLKGPKHGGANNKVIEMVNNIKANASIA